MEQLIGELRAAGRNDVTAMRLDYLLWNRGQQPLYKRVRPRHRTRTVFY
ncbi:MAG: queuosine salvage family protein [Actinomycetota bacterium]|nr:queuosine salvage family protein [Actinomycetota bacterium]